MAGHALHCGRCSPLPGLFASIYIGMNSIEVFELMIVRRCIRELWWDDGDGGLPPFLPFGVSIDESMSGIFRALVGTILFFSFEVYPVTNCHVFCPFSCTRHGRRCDCRVTGGLGLM